MKPVFLSLAAAIAMTLPAAHVLAGMCGGGPINSPDVLAAHILADIDAGELDFVEGTFDPAMNAALPAPALANAWNAYQDQLGGFRSQGQPIVDSQGAQTVVRVPVQLAKGQGEVRMTLNADMTIDSLAFLPAATPTS